MHIKKIEIKNWLGIKELLFSPGKMNKVSGDSGTGKTSFIEALEKIFTNKNRRTEVIRHDAGEAELFVELDDGLQTTRKIRSEKADYLKVKHESKAVSSTEAFLRKLINGDIFRPIEFVQKNAKEQTEIILNMLQIDWTVDDIKAWFGEVPEADYQLHILQILKQIETGYYAERESINREINLLRANIEGIKRDLPSNYDGEEWREVNLQELYKKLSDAEESNKRLEEAQTLIDGLSLRIDDIKRRMANASEEKRLDYSRQRDMLKSSITRLEDHIQREQAHVDDAEQRVLEVSARLDHELEQAIERLKLQYQAKKQAAREEIQMASEQSRVFIAEYKEQIAEKRATLGSLDEHERKDLEKITDQEANLIASEQAKTGNAQEVVANTVWVDTAPLKEAADHAASMKEYLREWERMNDIIREKLTPKEERSAELTAKIKRARELPKELLKTAALPVDGLSVDEQGRIRIHDTLIDGLSEGESLEFAFKLAKAQAGPLKVICVDGWQNLGSKQRDIIEVAKTDDYQYFVLETVDGQDLNIEIVEG
ncbi:AAA family ATPase [Paenibacillus larvae]|uniref:AAA family ATPase n=1 Tax=Paenibacillus larvae TaxID=1464 RepID=UPI0022825C83|nr:AAA family ATPase [Paenibacillus larvae]MCY9511772.1 AAA family ATPase [Paenibacillus larvae]MCY9527640.1 AAA family ATPase [Paenibacillus larvae]